MCMVSLTVQKLTAVIFALICYSLPTIFRWIGAGGILRIFGFVGAIIIAAFSVWFAVRASK